MKREGQQGESLKGNEMEFLPRPYHTCSGKGKQGACVKGEFKGGVLRRKLSPKHLPSLLGEIMGNLFCL